jgi:hypothetical protein
MAEASHTNVTLTLSIREARTLNNLLYCHVCGGNPELAAISKALAEIVGEGEYMLNRKGEPSLDTIYLA